MRSLLHLSFIGAAHAAVVRRDTTYTQNVRDSTLAQSFGTVNQNTTVNPGVQVWLSGGLTHNWFGNVNNFGNIINSQTDFFALSPAAVGLISTWTGTGSANANLVNNAGGSIYLDDWGPAANLGSSSATGGGLTGGLTGGGGLGISAAPVGGPKYTWTLNSMQNYGNIQWCGRGDIGDSVYSLFCSTDCHNYGVIDWQQYNSNLGAAFTWNNGNVGTSTTNVYNDGAFRLNNVTFHSTQNVYGQGCWVIDQNAVLFLEDGSGTVLEHFSVNYLYPVIMLKAEGTSD